MTRAAAARGHRRRLARLLALAAVVAGFIAVANADAYWTASGSGSANGNAGTLAASTLGATPGAGTVALSWSAVTPPGSGSVSYYVSRNGGNAGGDCPTSAAPSSSLSCTDSGLAAGSYSYTVTVVWRTWSSTSSPATPVTLTTGAFDHFLLSAASGTVTAGTADNLTITAKDSAGNTVGNYVGSHNLTFSGAGSIGANNPTVSNSTGSPIAFGTATAISFTSGVATVSGSSNGVMKLYKAQTANILVGDGSGHSSNTVSVTVNPGSTASISVANPGAQTAGSPFSLIITALDGYGNTANLNGSQAISFTGAVNSPNNTAPSFPATVTFSNGTATAANITLTNADSTSLNVTSAGFTSSTGAFTVNPGSAGSFALGNPGAQVAGTQFGVTITAKDAYGNTATGYGGSKTVTFSGPANAPNGTAPGYPASVSFTSGVGTAGVTLYNYSTTTNLTATQGSLSGSTGNFTVNAGAINSFALATPAAQTAGTAFNIASITARDAWNNTANGYTGSQCVAFSGPLTSPGGSAPAYPAQGGCTSGSAITFTNGAATNIPVTLFNATPSTLYPTATTTITATDVPTGKSGSTGAFNVSGTGVQTRFVIIPATTTPVSGQADNLTIIMGDPYGNPVTAYAGNVNLYFAGANNAPNGTHPTVTPRNSTTGTNFTASTSITFTAGVSQVNAGQNGVMRLYRVETANVTVRLNAGTPSYLSNAVAITVQQSTLATLTATTPAAQTAGTAFNLALAAVDASGNGYNGTLCMTFSGPSASPGGTTPSYPAQGTCALGQSAITFTNGAASVPITLYRAAATTITATDASTGVNVTTGSFTVNAAAQSKFLLTAATTTPAVGAADALTITAADAYGNTVTGYTGSHNLTFSGARAIGTNIPTVTNATGTATSFGTATAITFTNGVSSAGGSMRLYRAETASIVVSDGTYSSSGLTITAQPGAISGLSLAAVQISLTPGEADNLTVRAIDAYGNTAPTYTGSHSLTFAGATGTATVTNSAGTAINFGSATALTFASGVSTVSGSSNGQLKIYTAQRANVTVADGTYTSSALSIVVSSVTASSVVAGGFHTCAVVNGGVECWGLNDSGQLGNNTVTNSSTPVVVVGAGGAGTLSGISQVAPGKYHTCALRSSDGSVWCWGDNTYGQLGNNTTTDSHLPVEVLGVGGTGYLTGVSQIDADGNLTCAVLASGAVRCWGHNQYGQVGNNTTTDTHVPVAVVGVGGTGTLGGVSSITTGANHACALLAGGTVDCWGYNNDGQLGNNSTTNSSAPVAVSNASGTGSLSGVSAISGGRLHTCALLGNSVWCWGDNDNGELGDGTTTSRSLPVQAGTISTATSVSAGEYHSCATLADGTAQCWGAAAYGQVGDGTTADTSSPVSVIGPGGYGLLSGISLVSAGGADINETNDYEHTCALMNDGSAVCWGQNNYGQLGNGTTTMSISPVGVALQ